MVFLRIRPGSRSSRSPSWAWKNCIIPSKHVKTLKQGSSAEFSCFTRRDCKPPQWNKPFLNRSIFPRCIESRCTEKNQARSLMTSTHASVRCSILVFTDIQEEQEYATPDLFTMGPWHGEISSNVTFAYCTKWCIGVVVLRGRPLTHVRNLSIKPEPFYRAFSFFFLHENSKRGCIRA